MDAETQSQITQKNKLPPQIKQQKIYEKEKEERRKVCRFGRVLFIWKNLWIAKFAVQTLTPQILPYSQPDMRKQREIS